MAVRLNTAPLAVSSSTVAIVAVIIAATLSAIENKRSIMAKVSSTDMFVQSAIIMGVFIAEAAEVQYVKGVVLEVFGFISFLLGLCVSFLQITALILGLSLMGLTNLSVGRDIEHILTDTSVLMEVGTAQVKARPNKVGMKGKKLR